MVILIEVDIKKEPLWKGSLERRARGSERPGKTESEANVPIYREAQVRQDSESDRGVGLLRS